MNITFVLPGDNRSGGVRVTTVMGNLLLERGHRVRIIHPRPKLSLIRKLQGCMTPGHRNKGWLSGFKGDRLAFDSINKIPFLPNEVVFAVGTYMIPYVYDIKDTKVIKVRYNHGLPVDLNVRINDEWTYQRCWSVPMRTITVSKTLIPKLQDLTRAKIDMVVPNGIDTSEYFDENRTRDGICAVFSPHPNKAPEDLKKILCLLHDRKPSIPQYIFSENARPPELIHAIYHRLPSIPEVRSIYNQSKLFLLASYNEGLPGTVLEAMACGAVVISSDNDGSLEVIEDGTNGIIRRMGDIEGFVSTIMETFADSKKVQSFQEKGFATAARFTWQRAADAMEAFLGILG